MVKLLHVVAAVASVTHACAYIPPFVQEAIDSGVALGALNSLALVKTIGNFQSGCDPSKLKYRQEWRTLTASQRKNYIAAVQCLQTTPSLFPAGQVPGSISLFDDFVAVHLNQTPYIHVSAQFLTWHRYFIHTYEQKLQACGYTGNLPYWEWGYDVKSPRNSPVFDGSATSLGSDGVKVSHAELQLAQPGENPVVVHIPEGTGGGCIQSGPFANLSMRLGPVSLPVYGSTDQVGQKDPMASNPRCVSRDLNPNAAQRWTTFRNTTDLITQYDNIEWFQAVLQGDPRYPPGVGNLGVHGGGHYTIGGNPGGDAFISNGDPAFYVHHGQIDRVYWIWQMLDFANRQNIWGTSTLMNNPPSANMTLDDIIDISPLNKPIKIRDLMNTVGGPFCYVYV